MLWTLARRVFAAWVKDGTIEKWLPGEVEAGQEEPLPEPAWTGDNVGVDALVTGEELSPRALGAVIADDRRR